jgi:hypothetical protein
MIRTLFKWALLAAVAYGGYKGVEMYALLQLAPHMAACQLKERTCPLVDQRAGGKALTDALNEVVNCVADRQSPLESLVLPWRKTFKPIADGAIDYAQLAALCRP